MTPNEALEEVKKELEGLFGKGLMGVLVIGARNKSKAPIIGMTKEHYLSFLEALAADERVVNMLGAAGIKQKLPKWRSLAK